MSIIIKGTETQPGIIPQAIQDIFDYIKGVGRHSFMSRHCIVLLAWLSSYTSVSFFFKSAETKEFLLRVSYMEIYNEAIHDLLCPESGDLRIHEDKQVI